jgi:PAN domain
VDHCDYPGNDVSPYDTTADTLQECAGLCIGSTSSGSPCDAFSFIQQPVEKADPNCFLKKGLGKAKNSLPRPRRNKRHQVVFLRSCDQVQFTGEDGLLQQGQQPACAEQTLDGKAVCAPEGAFAPDTAANLSSAAAVYTAARPLLQKPAAFKQRCPLDDVLSGAGNKCAPNTASLAHASVLFAGLQGCMRTALCASARCIAGPDASQIHGRWANLAHERT